LDALRSVINARVSSLSWMRFVRWQRMQLLRSRRNDIAKEMHIAPSHLRWYAAYHNKDKNPHVHMLVWSDRPREAYLDKT